MKNNISSMSKPEVIDEQDRAQVPTPFDQDTCAIEVNDDSMKHRGRSPAKAVGYSSKAARRIDAFNDGIAQNNDETRPAAGPEILGNDTEAPAPYVPTVGFISKLKNTTVIMKDLQRISPGNTIPTLEIVKSSQSSNRYSSTEMKSCHSSAKENSLSEKGLAVACPVTDDDKPVCIASKYDPPARSSFYKSAKCHVYTAIVLFLTGAVVAIAVVSGTRRETEGNVIVQSPTMMPTKHRQARIRQVIEDNNIIERNATFNDMKDADPRYLALDWIVNEDRLQLTSFTESKLLQRYILAILAFSFDLVSWECGMVEDPDFCNITDDFGDYALWLSFMDECTWYGVECNDDGVVTGLDLSSNNLIGQIPPEISGLRSLSLLALQENCIYGTIPQEVFKLNLSEIDLSWNYLSGVVPQELYGLESLTQLNLHGNKDEGNCNRTDREPQPVSSKGLGGTILDARIGKLQNLKILQVYMNSFNGTIAPEVGQLNRLEKLAANSNNFTGSFPEQVSQMLNLKTLWLGNNSITGRIPESIGLIKSLETLSLWGNSMRGTIPDSLYYLTNLKALHLRHNSPGFEGTVSSDVGKLVNLKELVLNDNPLLTGTVPSELGLCSELKEIRLHNTQMTGTMPSEVCNLTAKKLNLDYAWSESFFEADCLNDNVTLPPFLVCECCSTCCDHTTKLCFNKDL